LLDLIDNQGKISYKSGIILTIMITNCNVNVVRQLKNLDEGDLNSYSIPIYKDDGSLIGWLKPINTIIANDELIVASLTCWRQKFMKYFLTQFQANSQRTSLWLHDTVLADDTRILFLIVDDTGKAIGNFGVNNINQDSAELDNLIRGEKGGDTQLIFFSEIALIQWLYRKLEIKNIYLHVFSNNIRTIALHSSIGFEKHQVKCLTKSQSRGEIFYEISDKALINSEEIGLVKMRINRNYFLEKYTNQNKV
jgi:RimJ/RimL family protein N-acetyltransferase